LQGLVEARWINQVMLALKSAMTFERKNADERLLAGVSPRQRR
jgi:hypothetical protein